MSIHHAQARKTESSLQRLKKGAQRRAGVSSDVSDPSVSDTDKLCMQYFLDIQVRIVLHLPLSFTHCCAPISTSMHTTIVTSTHIEEQLVCMFANAMVFALLDLHVCNLSGVWT
jgi:hypothetical protein